MTERRKQGGFAKVISQTELGAQLIVTHAGVRRPAMLSRLQNIQLSVVVEANSVVAQTQVGMQTAERLQLKMRVRRCALECHIVIVDQRAAFVARVDRADARGRDAVLLAETWAVVEIHACSECA